MITLKPVPLFGIGMAGKSYTVTRQRRLNCYLEQRKDGDKTKIAIYGTPGLVPAFAPPVTAASPMRGMLGTQTHLYLVAYSQFLSVSAAGTAIATKNVNSLTGNVSMANDATQVIIADGINGYRFIPATTAFSTLGPSFPVGARTVTFVSGFFVAEQPGTQNFWVSNAYDGSTWNALAFAAASAYSDNILAVDNLGGNLIVFSEQHYEIWQNSGLQPVPFTPILSAVGEYGLAAIFSRAHIGDSLIFLAQNREGQAQFVRILGFNVQVISDPDLDYIVNSFATVSDAVALTYGADNHKFYQVSFSGANRSFLYDTTSGAWSEVQTGPSLDPVRHAGNLSTYYAGDALISDYSNNQIYRMSPTAYTDNGVTIARELITRHVSSSFNRIRPAAVYIDMETGIGLTVGQGAQPQAMLQYSKDNGHTWSAERWTNLGPIGSYKARANWRRFGSSRDCTFRLRVTDPIKFVVTEGAMKVRQKGMAA